jgi:hypothetical protein
MYPSQPNSSTGKSCSKYLKKITDEVRSGKGCLDDKIGKFG